MSISKDVIKQCLISKQREVDEAVIVNRPVDFENNGNYVIVATGSPISVPTTIDYADYVSDSWLILPMENEIGKLAVKEMHVPIPIFKQLLSLHQS